MVVQPCHINFEFLVARIIDSKLKMDLACVTWSCFANIYWPTLHSSMSGLFIRIKSHVECAQSFTVALERGSGSPGAPELNPEENFALILCRRKP